VNTVLTRRYKRPFRGGSNKIRARNMSELLMIGPGGYVEVSIFGSPLLPLPANEEREVASPMVVGTKMRPCFSGAYRGGYIEKGADLWLPQQVTEPHIPPFEMSFLE